jgi:hypothetical protein
LPETEAFRHDIVSAVFLVEQQRRARRARAPMVAHLHGDERADARPREEERGDQRPIAQRDEPSVVSAFLFVPASRRVAKRRREESRKS